MFAMWATDKTFFQRPLEVAPDGLLDGSATVEVGAD